MDKFKPKQSEDSGIKRTNCFEKNQNQSIKFEDSGMKNTAWDKINTTKFENSGIKKMFGTKLTPHKSKIGTAN